ncbi:MAG: hypothetical protein ACI9ON_003365 [Limisphaerales bacterium]|jgi:hypothetical protein
MNHRLAILAPLCVCLAFTASAKEKIGIPETVPFSDFASVPDAVRAECQLGEQVAQFVKRYGKNIEFSDVTDSGKYVEMEITEVFAPGGGVFSGPKWMEVSGTLKENGDDIASFRAKRFSTGGAFGGFKGTCSIIGRCTKALGKDIATWIKKPVDGAELGDAQ